MKTLFNETVLWSFPCFYFRSHLCHGAAACYDWPISQSRGNWAQWGVRRWSTSPLSGTSPLHGPLVSVEQGGSLVWMWAPGDAAWDKWLGMPVCAKKMNLYDSGGSQARVMYSMDALNCIKEFLHQWMLSAFNVVGRGRHESMTYSYWHVSKRTWSTKTANIDPAWS